MGRVGVAMNTQQEVDEDKIRRHIDQLVEGLQAKDLDCLSRIYATRMWT
jgi:hypothetical protein